MRFRLIAFLAVFLVACGAKDSLAIRGDSTAIASRSGIAKIFNYAPSWDSKRWWVMVADELGRKPFNDGVGGQDIHTMRVKMEADQEHRNITTIIYDLRNSGEDPTAYVADLAAAVATLQTNHFLIMPQVPKAKGFPDNQDQINAMKAIDEAVLTKWPKNTFSRKERAEFLAELEPDTTRIDHLHRNEIGQEIERRWIGGWLKARSW